MIAGAFDTSRRQVAVQGAVPKTFAIVALCNARPGDLVVYSYLYVEHVFNVVYFFDVLCSFEIN